MLSGIAFMAASSSTGVSARTADGAAISIDPAGTTCRNRWRGKMDGVSWHRLGMDCACGAAPAEGRKDGTWRRTVPMARLRCRDTEEEHFGHKEFGEEQDYMDSGGWKCGGTAPVARLH